MSNRNVYNLETLQAQIKALGLSENHDLKILKDAGVLSNGKSYLEIGAGSGRVIDELKKLEWITVYAIEHSHSLCDHLRGQYDHMKPNVQIFHGDISKDVIFKDGTIDVVLLMFSTFLEFTQTQQRLVLKKIAGLIKSGGQIAIDNVDPLSFDLLKLPQHARLDGSSLTVHVPHGKRTRNLKLHLLTPNELMEMAVGVGLKLQFQKCYGLGELSRYCAVFTQP